MFLDLCAQSMYNVIITIISKRSSIMRNKQTINISVSRDTKERLKEFAAQNHTTISQAITDWIWKEPVHETTETEMEEK